MDSFMENVLTKTYTAFEINSEHENATMAYMVCIMLNYINT